MERTLGAIIVILGVSLTSSITTTHHDKPKIISTIRGVTTDSSISSTAMIVTNVTLSPSERKKRLLPYQNFYFNQPFNRPHQAGVSAQQYKDYEDFGSINKKPDYESVSLRPKDILYQPGQKFTPFLESNALPGHFRPMALGNSPQKVQYTYVSAASPTHDDKFLATNEQLPSDFSAIYDTLSQLKLRQQDLHSKSPYGYRLVQHHRIPEEPRDQQQYRPSIFDSPTRFKINPSKTTIETFTATNIDIPDPTDGEKYEFPPPRHHQVPTPTKEQFSAPAQTYYKENTKPFIRHQIAIEVPQSSLPLTFSPSLARKPSTSKERPRKPYIFIQQGKPDVKQPVLILRKPKPAVVNDENFVAEKYISQEPSKLHHYQYRPIYTPQESQYSTSPGYQNNFDTQYQVTAAPVEYNQPYHSTVKPTSYNQLEYVAKLTPEPQNVDNGPQKIEYTPQRVEYTPQRLEFAPHKAEYIPEKVQYAPQKLEYAPQKVESYTPEKVKYTPQKLEYAPQKVESYAPQKMEYAPQKVKYVLQKYEPQNVEYETEVTSTIPQFLDHNKYYQYQTVAPGHSSSVAPIPVHNAIRVPQKVVPQYQLPMLQEDVAYRVKPQNSKLENTGDNSNSLSEILKQLQESNTLPHTLTPDNIDNSIKTLVKILNTLRDRQKQQKPVIAQDQYDYENEAGVDLGGDPFDTPDGGTPGKAGVDYPALYTIPKTNFNCKTQRYKGFFGDPDTNCQVWHYCDLNGGQASFLCPNGTIFSQVALTCDWWYNVKCSSTAQLYVLNERLYKYIIPLSPKFPEDYSGPLVDKYLALKFQEMEEKLRKQKKGKANGDSNDSDDDSDSSDSEDLDDEEDSSKEESETIEESETPTTADTDANEQATTRPVNQ